MKEDQPPNEGRGVELLNGSRILLAPGRTPAGRIQAATDLLQAGIDDDADALFNLSGLRAWLPLGHPASTDPRGGLLVLAEATWELGRLCPHDDCHELRMITGQPECFCSPDGVLPHLPPSHNTSEIVAHGELSLTRPRPAFLSPANYECLRVALANDAWGRKAHNRAKRRHRRARRGY